MKQWQQDHLHRVLDKADWMNNNCWWAVIIGGLQIIVGALVENVAVSYAGAAILTAGVAMTFAVSGAIFYIRWRKKKWK